MSFLSYPRLNPIHAAELIVKVSDPELTPAARLELAAEYKGRASFYATAKTRVSDAGLATLRGRVLDVAAEQGFPERPRAGSGFDSSLPAVLADSLSLSPAEAGVRDVWNYLTLVVMPDVALWRWPNAKRDPGYERLVGKPRNVFRRHWWRALLLGPELASQLMEDETVQIVERAASIGGDPKVARALANAFLHHVLDESVEVARMDLMRSAAARVLRLGRVVVLSSLSVTELRVLMDEVVGSSAVALQAATNE